MSFNWWFAAGSQVSIVWKNSMQPEEEILFISNWSENIHNTFNSNPQNSFSFKIVYYLDYLYLKKKNDKSK